MKPTSTNLFEPRKQFEKIQKNWIGLFFCMLIGAVIGYSIHLLMPPVYQSSAEITFSIDYTRTGSLTDVEEDVAIVTAGDIISSSNITKEVIEEGIGLGFTQSDFEMGENAFLERYNFRYVLVVQHNNKDTASKLANLWVAAANKTLLTARQHSLNADDLYRQMLGLQECIQNSGQALPVAGVCSDLALSEVQEKLRVTNNEYLKEKEMSLAYLPALDFSITNQAVPSDKPVARLTGALIFSGALLGGVVFIFWSLIHNNKRREH